MSKRAANNLARQGAILDAAARVFRLRCYHGATLRDIATEAGMLLRSLQYRYETKEGLFLALADREYERMVSLLDEAKGAGGGPLESVRRYLELQTAALQGEDTALLFLLNASPLPEELARGVAERFSRFNAALDALLEAAVADGSLRRDRPTELLRYALFGPLLMVAQLPLQGAPPASSAELVAGMWQLALEGLRAQA